MFVMVLYGDNEHALFNTLCKIPVLLDCIKQKCHYEAEEPNKASTPVYVPLLNNDNIVNSKFLAKLGAQLDSLSQNRGNVKKMCKKSASPSPSRSSTTDGKQRTSPNGKHKNISTPQGGKH
ncbi:uncharacterized protein LOC125466993 isoform X3 [Stegostoma tigrinum]|uniref:uncharacterized protein LOC125466993 isoform X3 n=1 Tax=Stegostoma tigrinum TaxID=3053191 RepID=UPI00286FCAB5|nr:uncharacterized protein LOC125466993 isoform X3 [Stegostoma tigrinum]